jgi:Na+/H+ antiporter NhaD/arsenite permease-like protein
MYPVPFPIAVPFPIGNRPYVTRASLKGVEIMDMRIRLVLPALILLLVACAIAVWLYDESRPRTMFTPMTPMTGSKKE